MDDAARSARSDDDRDTHALAVRRTVAVVAALNFGYFFVEATAATLIASVALFADSIDFLEDASVNLLVLMALGWSALARRRTAVVLAALLLVPGIAAIWTAAQKLLSAGAAAPAPLILTAAGVGALAVNAIAALMLAHIRHAGGSLTRAAFLSARNDVLANVAIIAAGVATALTLSIWPDLIVGIAIAALNIGAAWEVFEASLEEDDGNGGAPDLVARP